MLGTWIIRTVQRNCLVASVAAPETATAETILTQYVQEHGLKPRVRWQLKADYCPILVWDELRLT